MALKVSLKFQAVLSTHEMLIFVNVSGYHHHDRPHRKPLGHTSFSSISSGARRIIPSIAIPATDGMPHSKVRMRVTSLASTTRLTF
jgi:hypothetical protein